MTFRTTRIGFIIAGSVIGLLHYFCGISLCWLIAPTLIAVALLVYGSGTIQSNFHAKAYCSGNSTEKEIALTFDDGPNPVYTPKVLSLLAEYQTPATFFVIGKHIPGNESILKQIDADGHSIGNHTYTHSFFIDFKSTRAFKDELSRTSDAVYKIIGKRMRLFRPPYGVTTPHLAKASKGLGYRIIGWNIRSLDTTSDSADIITQRVLTQIKPGAVILFHDTSDKTVEVLKRTLAFAQANDYKIVTIERLLGIKAYELTHAAETDDAKSGFLTWLSFARSKGY